MLGKTIIYSLGALMVLALPVQAARPQKKSASTEKKYYTEIKSLEEHDRICESSNPSVIVYNSSSCTACTLMEPGLNKCAKEYGKKAKFYVIDAENPSYSEKLRKKVEITGYPRTYFRKKGEEPRIERGSIPAEEFDQIVYHFVTGKPKPYKKPENNPSDKPEIKKSLQEEQE